MKLIRKLSLKRDKNGNFQSFAIFWCENCEQEVIKRLSHGKIQKSCGCDKNFNNGNKYALIHGKTNTKLYSVWSNIKDRCLNLNCKSYKYYGGRGITICNEWLEFTPFMEWALGNGYNRGLQIDRKETNGNYEPSNCRWVTSKEQQRNKRNTTTLEIANEIRLLYWSGKYLQKELAEKYKIHPTTISNIIRNKIWKND